MRLREAPRGTEFNNAVAGMGLQVDGRRGAGAK